MGLEAITDPVGMVAPSSSMTSLLFPLKFERFLQIEVTDDEDEPTEAFVFPPREYRRSSLFPFCRATRSRRSLACPYGTGVEKSTTCFLQESRWSLGTDREADVYGILKS